MSVEPKVSVVMPVYNTAPYLRQCLNSVVNQTLRDIEIICVDDGSTDDSLAILKEYAAADSRIRILHQQNQYAGVARNNGMAVAAGKYLMFWDSDDYFDLTALEKMYNQCELDKADICVCGGKRFYHDSQREVITKTYLRMNRIPEEIPFNRLTSPDNILRFTDTATWNKLYLRSFIKKKGIEFKPLRNGNDVFFSILALCEADRITVLNEHLVCYRKWRPGSLINTLTRSPLSLIDAWMEVGDELNRRSILPKKSFDNRVSGIIKHSFVQIDSWNGFIECFEYLQKEGLKKLDLKRQPEGYYDKSTAEFLDRLFQGNPHDFLLYLFHSDHAKLVEANDVKTQNQAEIKRLKVKVKTQTQELKKLKATPFYKAYRLLRAPIRKLKRMLKHS